jgi:hypothetical protein
MDRRVMSLLILRRVWSLAEERAVLQPASEASMPRLRIGDHRRCGYTKNASFGLGINTESRKALHEKGAKIQCRAIK